MVCAIGLVMAFVVVASWDNDPHDVDGVMDGECVAPEKLGLLFTRLMMISHRIIVFKCM